MKPPEQEGNWLPDVLTARWTNQGETLLDMGTQTTWEETC
jgi:hypothetical protein